MASLASGFIAGKSGRYLSDGSFAANVGEVFFQPSVPYVVDPANKSVIDLRPEPVGLDADGAFKAPVVASDSVPGKTWTYSATISPSNGGGSIVVPDILVSGGSTTDISDVLQAQESRPAISAQMRTLVVEPVAPDLTPLDRESPISTSRVSIYYTSRVSVEGRSVQQVVLTDEALYGRPVRVPVLCSDDPGITSGAGFGVVVEIVTPAPRGGSTVVERRTISITRADDPVVYFGDKPGAEIVDATVHLDVQQIIAQAREARDAAASAEAATVQAASAATLAAQTAAAEATKAIGDRTLAIVDAPTAGTYLVGTNDFGLVAESSASVASRIGALSDRMLVTVDAPSSGPWSLGTNDFSTAVGGGVDAAFVHSQIDATRAPDVGAASGGRGWVVAGRAQGSDTSRIVVTGDSLDSGYPRPPFATDGSTSWVGALAGRVGAGVTVSNLAVHGQTAAEAAVRGGGIQIVTSSEVTVPGDASWVALPSGVNVPTIFSGAFIYDMTAPGGVAVQVRHESGASWSIRRATSGSALTIPAGTTLGVPAARLDAVHVIAGGRNDLNGGLTEANLSERVDQAVAATVAMVDSLTPRRPAFMVIGTITGTNETRDTLGHRGVTEINRRLKALYPAQWWDRNRYLIDQSWKDLGLTLTAADQQAIAGDTHAPQLSHDGLHYTVAAASAIGAAIHTEITKRGLLT